MSYILEYRDEHEYNEVLEKLNKAKKVLSEVCEMMEQTDGYSERNGMRGGYRGGYREDYRDDDWSGDMKMRRGRNGRYSY